MVNIESYKMTFLIDTEKKMDSDRKNKLKKIFSEDIYKYSKRNDGLMIKSETLEVTIYPNMILLNANNLNCIDSILEVLNIFDFKNNSSLAADVNFSGSIYNNNENQASSQNGLLMLHQIVKTDFIPNLLPTKIEFALVHEEKLYKISFQVALKGIKFGISFIDSKQSNINDIIIDLGDFYNNVFIKKVELLLEGVDKNESTKL